MNRLTTWIPALLLVVVTLPQDAFAQTMPEDWTRSVSSKLEKVYVKGHAGDETAGTLLRLDSESLTLIVDGVERRFVRDEIARIEKRDSLRNGTIIGAVFGLAMGVLAGGISDCPGDDPGGRCLGFRTSIVAISPLFYGAMGAGVDSLIRGRSPVYVAPTGSSSRASLQLAPGRGVVAFRHSW